jgi:hypothetical protein
MKQNNTYKLGSLATFALATVQAQAGVIAVPNGSFETLFKPGSTTITALTVDSWTHGVGMNAQMDPGGGSAAYSDATTGNFVDVPGWINAPGWSPSYDWASGPGSVAAQNPAADGISYYTTNGTDYGNNFGGAIQSAASLATIGSGESYTLSMFLSDTDTAPVSGRILSLMANGVVLTPSSFTGSSGAPGTWNQFTNTYSAATLAGFVGQNLTIRVGWASGASGTQSQLDNVTLTSVPEATSLSLLAISALMMTRRKRG